MKLYSLNALLSRMKYIPRWGLMRASRTETLCEHTADTALLAHMLCCISSNIYGTDVRSEKVAVAALYHDASEILTGDMPTPVKYKNDILKSAYKALELQSAAELATLVPKEMQDEMSTYLLQSELTEKEKSLLKAADRLSALIKCIDEEHSGNKEFIGAKQQQMRALNAMMSDEVVYFIDHMLPCYEYNLDELTR